MRERARFEHELRDLEVDYQAGATLSKSNKREDLYFEFDLNYGMEVLLDRPGKSERWPDASRDQYIRSREPVTQHRKHRDGFRVKMDGNRMEIATVEVALTEAGRGDLHAAMKNVSKFAAELEQGCRKATPLSIPAPGASTRVITKKRLGQPRFFELLPRQAVFPLGLNEKEPYFRRQCAVLAAPQATMDIPLASVDTLVSTIKRSEGEAPGMGLTGRHRPGVRSDALFLAQTKVNASRARHIRRATKLSTGKTVSASNFSPSLQGFMILLVQYLLTSVIRYSDRDYEQFAKAYVPLLSKTNFRDLYHRVLTRDERDVFMELYGDPKVRDALYALTGKLSGGDAQTLFPAKTQTLQERWFGRRLTWSELVGRTLDDTPILDIAGKESLPTPLAEATNGPPRVGPDAALAKGVRVELRRLGFNWVTARKWSAMTERLFDLAKSLNAMP